MAPSFNHAASLVCLLVVLLSSCSKKQDAAPPAAAEAAPQAAESPAVTASENVRPFKIGELSALALRDGGIELPNDNKVFGVGQTAEAVAAVLAAAGLPTDKLALTIEPLLVKTRDHVLLFDTGAGGNFGPGSGKLMASMSEAGIDPASVTDIFISHSHGDHVGGLVNGGALSFPGATIHISKPEWEHLRGLAEYSAVVPVIEPKVDAFVPGAELVPGTVKAVEIRGHTPGHSGYLISSGSESLLFVGDTVHHFVVSVQKPEWTIAFDGDAPTASKSRADLIARSAASGQRIYAEHFPFPGIGKFEKRGDAYVWVAE